MKIIQRRMELSHKIASRFLCLFCLNLLSLYQRHLTNSSTRVLRSEPISFDLTSLPLAEAVHDDRFPRIYIHDLPPSFNVDTMKGPINFTIEGEYGEGRHSEGYPEHVYETHQFSLEVMLHYRLLSSKHRTHKIEDADYVFLPFYRGFDHQNHEDKMWKRLFAHPIVYLNIPGIEFGQVPFIIPSNTGLKPDLVNSFVARNVLMIKLDVNRPPDQKNRTSPLQDLRMTVPFPSYVHLPYESYPMESRPWVASTGPRPILAYFIGSIRYSVEDPEAFSSRFYKARYLLQIAMNQSQEMIYQTSTADPSKRLGFQPVYALEYYKNSTFCPHIGGENCFRKAFYDSLLNGCIPVIFDRVACRNWQFGDLFNIEDYALILSYRHALTQRKLYEMLSEISQERIMEYRQNIQRIARHLQISLFDDDEDMIGIILQESKKILPYFHLENVSSMNSTDPLV